MEKSAVGLADELLARGPSEMDFLHVHTFPDDTAAHDDAATERLFAEFTSELDTAATELSEKYGPPIRTGDADVDDINLNGVFRFLMWEVDGIRLYVAAAHEDRGCPILLAIGTA